MAMVEVRHTFCGATSNRIWKLAVDLSPVVFAMEVEVVVNQGVPDAQTGNHQRGAIPCMMKLLAQASKRGR